MKPSLEQTYVDDKWLASRYGRHRSAVWRWARNGEFPKPVKIATGCSRWRLQDVLDHERRAAEGGA